MAFSLGIGYTFIIYKLYTYSIHLRKCLIFSRTIARIYLYGPSLIENIIILRVCVFFFCIFNFRIHARRADL